MCNCSFTPEVTKLLNDKRSRGVVSSHRTITVRLENALSHVLIGEREIPPWNTERRLRTYLGPFMCYSVPDNKSEEWLYEDGKKILLLRVVYDEKEAGEQVLE